MRKTMIDANTAMTRMRSYGAHALQLRDRLSRIDPGTAAVRAVAAGMVIGTASLLVVDADAHRNTDTKAEIVARIAPVGSVTVAAPSRALQTADAGIAAATVGNDS
jgi:hypothetical protein